MVKITDGKSEEKQKVERVRNFLMDHKPDLTIYRVPKKTLEMFKIFAKEEYANDYGMCLKSLIDYTIHDQKFQELSQRITVLEQKIFNETEKSTRTLSGRVIKLPR